MRSALQPCPDSPFRALGAPLRERDIGLDERLAVDGALDLVLGHQPEVGPRHGGRGEQRLLSHVSF